MGRGTRSSANCAAEKSRCAWIDEVVLSNAAVSGSRWILSPAAAQDRPRRNSRLPTLFGAKQSGADDWKSSRRDGTPISPATCPTHHSSVR